MLNSMRAVTQISIPQLNHVRSGKVREIFDLGDSYLMVATDRVSAFDVVLPTGIPDKGKVLNQLSLFWFAQTSAIVENHLIEIQDAAIAERIGEAYDSDQLAGRCMIVKKCEPFAIECVARSYIAGSLFKEYLAKGGAASEVTVHGIRFTPSLRNCDKLPAPIFTPATKATSGHDENISFEQASQIVGEDHAAQLRELTLRVFEVGVKICEKAGILLADTKYEFGLLNGKILLIDEVMTPDSSRFWPADCYEPGKSQQSLDKQFVRDYLETLDWNKSYPGPKLPDAVAQETRKRYIEIFKRITGADPVL